MILTGNKINEEVIAGNITIEPYSPSNLNPNSYNFHLGDYVLVYENDLLDAKSDNPVKRIDISEDGIVLQPNKIYLGFTKEKMGSDVYVPIISGRSSTGRLGIFVHITANLIDIGSHNNWTLMMHSVQPVRVYKGMSIGQVTFWKTDGQVNLYNGKYQNASGPMSSKSWKDFKN